jgi:hypothetical protein
VIVSHLRGGIELFFWTGFIDVIAVCCFFATSVDFDDLIFFLFAVSQRRGVLGAMQEFVCHGASTCRQLVPVAPSPHANRLHDSASGAALCHRHAFI